MKGHQIIGELRQKGHTLQILHKIERSPDHWWVTTKTMFNSRFPVTIERSPDHWWVTTGHNGVPFNLSHWKVTRSLVSYDLAQKPAIPSSLLKGHQIIGELRLKPFGLSGEWRQLKGHQIIGELRPIFSKPTLAQKIERSPDHWWVTTVLPAVVYSRPLIERSPDHWWVTTVLYMGEPPMALLKGHQIIGELRLWRPAFNDSDINWKVTRSLVSYDPFLIASKALRKDWKVTRSLVSYD